LAPLFVPNRFAKFVPQTDGNSIVEQSNKKACRCDLTA